MDQAQQVANLGLDQVADVVNRQKIGDKRLRNEMMRLGTTDPSSFAMNNQSFLQQAQQPSEFLGAGRKDLTPDVDRSLLGALGGYVDKSKNLYYSDYDLSKASWGAQDADDIDLGSGKYQIMSNGQSLGTGYKSLSDTIKDYGYGDKATGNNLRDWETLGQILNYGSPTGNYSTSRAMGGNKQSDQISGLNTLFGSKAIIYDGKLLGYSQDQNTNPLVNKWNRHWQWEDGGGWFEKPTQHYQWDVGASALGREYNNPTWWNMNTKRGTDGTYFIGADKAASSPGWGNSDFYKRNSGHTESGGGFGIGSFTGSLMQAVDPALYYAHDGGEWFKDVDKQGLYGAIFDRLDPWLDDLDLGHEMSQEGLRELTGNETQKETFQQIAPAMVSMFVPYGGYVNAADTANRGNWNGAIASLVGQAISQYAPSAAPTGTDQATGAATGSTGIYGTGTSLGSVAADKAVQAVVANTLTGTIANGGNLEQALKSAAFSAGSGAAGNWLANQMQSTYGDIASKALGGAASGGLNSLFSKNNAVAGSLYGGMSGGLHGFLNSISRGSEGKLSDSTNRRNSDAALTVSKLAKVFTKAK